jgi:hypothetical protein
MVSGGTKICNWKSHAGGTADRYIFQVKPFAMALGP